MVFKNYILGDYGMQKFKEQPFLARSVVVAMCKKPACIKLGFLTIFLGGARWEKPRLHGFSTIKTRGAGMMVFMKIIFITLGYQYRGSFFYKVYLKYLWVF